MDEDRATSGPRRSGLVQERSRRTRRALVDAALALWTERGFDDGIDDTTVEEIAQAAGVTKGTFYFHFAHKEDILLEIGWGTSEAMYKDTTKYLADERTRRRRVRQAHDHTCPPDLGRAAGRRRPHARRVLPTTRNVASIPVARTTGSSGPTPSCSRGAQESGQMPDQPQRARSPRCCSRSRWARSTRGSSTKASTSPPSSGRARRC